MPVSLVTTPPELLEHITLLAIRHIPRGPPTVLRSLLLTCQMSNNALSMDQNPHLYIMLFFDKFDILSPRRHLSQDRLSLHNLEQELKRRYVALQCIRRGELYHPDLANMFATIYIMLLEDDGRNWEQLLWANLPEFLHKFLRHRLLEGAAENSGWPVENEMNTLAVALLWLTMLQDRLESDELREEITELLSPYAFAGFRYPCFVASEFWYIPSDNIAKAAPPGYPPVRCNSLTVQYYGNPTSFCLPPIAIFAILGYFSRVEDFHLQVPPELPITRNEALSRGVLHGPTREDVEHFNTQCKTWLASATYGDRLDGLLKSRRHDPDRRRLICNPQSGPALAPPGFYIPGTLSGRWQGSFIAPCLDTYKAMLSSPNAPSPFPTFGRFPLYVRFRELYCYCPSMPLPLPEDENSFLNAYLPVGCHWHESESGIEFIGKNASFKAYYNPPRVECPSGPVIEGRDPSSFGALDVIITGVTEEPYATAWNGYRYIGRVRPSDGLVVLLREALDSNMTALGRSLFRGYIVSSRNFVGRWRHISGGEQPAEWESIFSLCKVKSM